MNPAFINDRIALSVLKDVTWWSWVAMIALLAVHLSGSAAWPIYAAAAACLTLMLCDLVLRRGDMRAMSVQIRFGYVILLMLGLLPGMSWIHWMQLAGTTVRVVTGYCLLQRELLMLPWNAHAPMTSAEMWRILRAPPGDGGLPQFNAAGRGVPNACALGK